jgi:hypothetical protein
MSARLVSIVVLAAALASGTSAQGDAHGQAIPAVEDLMDRVGRYVQQSEKRLAVVISEEDYRQEVLRWTGRSARRVRRTIRSEMLLMWLPEERVWFSVRNVLNVDGRRIPDSKERLDRAVSDPAPGMASRLRQLQKEGARFDLGPVFRTSGNPTLVLQFLLPANQGHFTFTRVGQERVGGDHAWKVTFAEREGPTVFRVNGEDMVSSGAIWVRESDGTVVRTNLKLARPTQILVSITVDFQRNAKLDLWVPSRMEEHYGEATACWARYSNFRRFETSGRVVQPE